MIFVTVEIAAAAAGSVTACLSLLHVYWAFGGRVGLLRAVPEKDGNPLFVPSAAASLLVALVLACFAATAWWVFYDHANRLAQIASGITAVIFLLRAIGDFRLVGFFKRLRNTSFARLDTLLYSPLCLVLGILYGVQVL